VPRACTICQHPSREAINRELAAHTAIPALAAKYRVSEDSLLRHRANHFPAVVAKAQEAEDVRQALDIVAQLKAINGAALTVLGEARRSGNGELALKAIDRIQRQIELQAKLLGELDERPQINLVVSPEWLRLRLVIVAALADHPAAQHAVLSALSASGVDA